MSSAVAEILKLTRSLSAEEKSELISELIESEDYKMSPEIEEAWLEEANRRFELIKSGKSKTHTFEEIKAKLHW